VTARKVALIVLLGPVLDTLVHESMHIAVLLGTGGQIHQVVILEVLQVVPSFAVVDATGAVYMMATTPASDLAKAFTWIAGAGSTFLISLAAIPIWLKKRTLPWLVVVLWSLDFVTYLALPSLGLKRWLFTGPPFSEVLEGLSFLGVGPGAVAAFLVAWTAGMATLSQHARKTKGDRRTS
jgi:hypothetical protein